LRKPLILVGASILGTLMPVTTYVEVGISDLLGSCTILGKIKLDPLLGVVKMVREVEDEPNHRTA
jgi:hypothetical protein